MTVEQRLKKVKKENLELQKENQKLREQNVKVVNENAHYYWALMTGDVGVFCTHIPHLPKIVGKKVFELRKGEMG